LGTLLLWVSCLGFNINHIASFFGCILMLLIGWKVLRMLHIL
jgi:hypothetical protein